MEENKQTMDDVSKFRITGAAIWLLLLIIIVPTWYSNPVNFKPESERTTETKTKSALVYQAYVLPSKSVLQSNEVPENSKPEVSTPKPIESKQPIEKPLTKTIQSAPAVVLPTENKTEPSVVPDRNASVETVPSINAGQWLVMVYSTKKIKDANKVLGLLDDKYEVWIKEFPKSKTFSVRTGPYSTKALAEKDKRKIDKAIRTQSKIVQVK